MTRPPRTSRARFTSRPDRAGHRRGGRRLQRGAALILAVVGIAILTAVAVDFAYNTRVDLQLAANQRDEVRAYYLAKSGIGLSRLLLKFQKQIDTMPIPGLDLGSLASNPMVAQMAQSMGVDMTQLGALTGGAGA